MNKKALFLLLCCTAAVFAACVSKNQYVELQNQLTSSQAQLETERRQLADLQDRYDKLQAANNSLFNTIEDLKFELRQEKTTVMEKEQAIAELDLLRKKVEISLKEELADKESELAQKEKMISELTKMRTEIEASLKEQIEQRDIKIEEIEGRLKVTFVDKILFDSGSVTIKPKGQEVLLKLADSFKNNQNQNIMVEGHTDDVQIGRALQARFPTNWELSAARAAAVVRFMQDKAAIDPQRMTAAGLSYYRPVASNETEEGRRENRRIEIILVPPR